MKEKGNMFCYFIVDIFSATEDCDDIALVDRSTLRVRIEDPEPDYDHDANRHEERRPWAARSCRFLVQSQNILVNETCSRPL